MHVIAGFLVGFVATMIGLAVLFRSRIQYSDFAAAVEMLLNVHVR